MTRPDMNVSAADGIKVSVEPLVRQMQVELRQLLQQRTRVTRRIAILKKTVVGLASLFAENALSEDSTTFLDRSKLSRKMGFTETCRAILIEADRPITASELCHRMRQRDPALFQRHKDPLASATTVLNRLRNYGEVDRVVLIDNKNSWHWATKPRAQVLE